MTREVSRRTSIAPEFKTDKAVRPDVPGLRRLDEKIVEDRIDPVLLSDAEREIVEAIARDKYLGSLKPTDGGK